MKYVSSMFQFSALQSFPCLKHGLLLHDIECSAKYSTMEQGS